MNRPMDGRMNVSLKRASWLCGKLLPAVLLMSIASAVIAQPPTDDWKEIELPAIKLPKGSASNKAAEKIQKALDGDMLAPTGDGALDDVIGIIHERGSVIDGSVLDSEFDPLADLVGRPSEAPDSGKSEPFEACSSTESFRLAEQLLATARMMEDATQASDTDRTPRIVNGKNSANTKTEMLPVKSLVYQMRLRAVELMQSGLKASSE